MHRSDRLLHRCRHGRGIPEGHWNKSHCHFGGDDSRSSTATQYYPPGQLELFCFQTFFKEIPFPAVSLKATKVHNAKRLLEQTLNTFKYDCFTAADDEVHKCRDESARFRQDFRPYIKKAIRDRYDDNYRELKKLVNGQDIYNKHPAYDAATFICKESLSMVQMEHRYWGHINTILFWLDDGGDNIEVMEDELIDLVVDSFR